MATLPVQDGRSLQGKVAVVTGANRGIGAAVAKLFAQHGAAIVVNYNRSREPAEQVVGDIETAGGRARSHRGGGTERGPGGRMGRAIVDRGGRAGRLVHNGRPLPMLFQAYSGMDSQ